MNKEVSFIEVYLIFFEGFVEIFYAINFYQTSVQFNNVDDR